MKKKRASKKSTLTEQKAEFRRSPEWRDWRKKLLEEHNYTCELCGRQYTGRASKTLHIHHIFQSKKIEHYRVLEESRFRVLCHPCHEFVTNKATSPNAKKLGISDWVIRDENDPVAHPTEDVGIIFPSSTLGEISDALRVV
jgi:5-methylcytosine-specific restriction endonuclease McrA